MMIKFGLDQIWMVLGKFGWAFISNTLVFWDRANII